MMFAAQADPSLQFADGRSADEIDAVAEVQRNVLLAAADLVGPGKEADALAWLAEVFVAGPNSNGPGRWSDEQWADALIARADPARATLLVGLESTC